jgi:hypothetical protein
MIRQNTNLFLNKNVFDFSVISDLIITAIEFPEKRRRDTVQD